MRKRRWQTSVDWGRKRSSGTPAAIMSCAVDRPLSTWALMSRFILRDEWAASSSQDLCFVGVQGGEGLGLTGGPDLPGRSLSLFVSAAPRLLPAMVPRHSCSRPDLYNLRLSRPGRGDLQMGRSSLANLAVRWPLRLPWVLSSRRPHSCIVSLGQYASVTSRKSGTAGSYPYESI